MKELLREKNNPLGHSNKKLKYYLIVNTLKLPPPRSWLELPVIIKQASLSDIRWRVASQRSAPKANPLWIRSLQSQWEEPLSSTSTCSIQVTCFWWALSNEKKLGDHKVWSLNYKDKWRTQNKWQNLGVTVRHVLDQAARGKAVTLRMRNYLIFSGDVVGNINHGPRAVLDLLTKSEDVKMTSRNQWGE